MYLLTQWWLEGWWSVVQNEPQVPLFQLFSVLNFKSWDSHVFYSVWDAFHHFFPNLHFFMEWGSSGLIKHCHCVLVWKLNWMFHGKLWWKLPFEYLNIILNITSFSPLNTNVITTLKYYHKQAINKKLILIRGVMKLFTKKKCWARKYLVLWSPELQYIFLKNLQNPQVPSPTYLIYMSY